MEPIKRIFKRNRCDLCNKHVKTCQRGIPEYNIWFFREVTQCDHAFILQYLAYVFRV